MVRGIVFQLRKLFGQVRELFIRVRDLFIGMGQAFIRAGSQDRVRVICSGVWRGIHWRSFPSKCHPKEGGRTSTMSRTRNTQCSFLTKA
jgi:hypothetical protein